MLPCFTDQSQACRRGPAPRPDRGRDRKEPAGQKGYTTTTWSKPPLTYRKFLYQKRLHLCISPVTLAFNTQDNRKGGCHGKNKNKNMKMNEVFGVLLANMPLFKNKHTSNENKHLNTSSWPIWQAAWLILIRRGVLLLTAIGAWTEPRRLCSFETKSALKYNRSALNVWYRKEGISHFIFSIQFNVYKIF